MNHIKYDAFGRVTGQSDGSKAPLSAFTGRDRDDDAEMHWYRARWYDAGSGRLLSEDPLGFDADDANLYRYVGNSPVMLGDPGGLAPGYGRYCGPRSGPGAPIDCLDRACQVHDGCVASWRDVIIPFRTWWCDQQLSLTAYNCLIFGCSTSPNHWHAVLRLLSSAPGWQTRCAVQPQVLLYSESRQSKGNCTSGNIMPRSTLFCLPCMFTAFAVFGLAVSCQRTNSPAFDYYSQFQSGGTFIGADPYPSPDGSLVLFATPETGHGDIYLFDTAAGTRKRLTDSSRWEGMARLSADKKTVAFVRDQDGKGRIILYDLQTESEKELTVADGDYIRPIISPDGAYVYATRYFDRGSSGAGLPASADVVKIDVASGSEERLTRNGLYDSATDLSSDGQLICFERNDMPFEIWLMDDDGGNQRRVCRGSSAAFLPESSQIVYNSDEFAKEIAIINLDGSNQRIVYSSRNYNSGPRASGPPTRVVFLSEPSGRGIGGIVSLNPETGAVVELTRTD